MNKVEFVVVNKSPHYLVRQCEDDPTEFLLEGQEALTIQEAWDRGVVSRRDITRDGVDIDPGNHL